MKRTIPALLCAVILVLTAAIVGGQPAPHGTYASAQFEVDHGNDCTRTLATIEVFRDPSPRPGNSAPRDVRVSVTYAVVGQPTSPGCDELFYIDLIGNQTLPSSVLEVHPGFRSASLRATMALFDGESGQTFDVDVSADWIATPGSGRSGSAVASLGIASPPIDPFVLLNPLFPSESARLLRVR